MCYSQDEFYSLVIAREYGKCIRDAQSRNDKWIYFMLSNNKFLIKCWYGGQPWIRLAMESESMVEKGINFIFYLGTAYGIFSMESVGNSKSFSLVGKAHLPKCFYLSIFALSSGTSTNPYFPPRRAFLLHYAIFYFEFESPSSLIKHQLGGTMLVLEHWV